jgi:hypothetical protein
VDHRNIGFLSVSSTRTWDTPARLNETARAFFETLAAISAPEEAASYGNVLDAKVQDEKTLADAKNTCSPFRAATLLRHFGIQFPGELSH